MIFYVPTEIIFGTGCLENFNFDVNYKKVLLLISKSLYSNDYINNNVIKRIKSDNVDVQILFPESGEPTTSRIDTLYKKIDKKADAVVAIGGGSVLDTAKFLSVMLCSGGNSSDYEFGNKKIVSSVPLYAIPSTSGSGSEVTPYAVATNDFTGRKFTIKNFHLFPKKSYIDPILLKTLPTKSLIGSALDAFIHGLESILNKNQNILIYDFAIKLMKNIYFVLTNRDPKNLRIKDYEKLALSSLYGGICISNSRTGMVHTFSVALSGYSKTLHGLLNANILPYVLEYNLDSYKGFLASIVSLVVGDIVRSDSEAKDILKDFVKNLASDFKIVFFKDPDPMHIVDRVMQDVELQDVNIKNFSRKDLIIITEEIICQK